DGEADTELGPTEQRGAASWSEVPAVLPRNPGMRLHHEGDAARPDRIKRPQNRRCFVVGLDGAGRDLVQRPDKNHLRVVLVDQVMDRGQVALLRDVERDTQIDRAHERENLADIRAETLRRLADDITSVLPPL